MTGKVRKTLTLDPQVVDALGDDPAALSATVNAILAQEITRRERHAALGRFLDRLDAEDGPVDREIVDTVRGLLT